MRSKVVLLAAALFAVFAGSPSNAQERSAYGPGTNQGEIDGMSITNSGVLATTPSRMARSRAEMNHGRAPVWRISPTPSMVRTYARRSLERSGIECSISAARLVSHYADRSPIVEVACDEGIGLMISDTDPVQATGCRTMQQEGNGVLGQCRLPRNVELLRRASAGGQ